MVAITVTEVVSFLCDSDYFNVDIPISAYVEYLFQNYILLTHISINLESWGVGLSLLYDNYPLAQDTFLLQGNFGHWGCISVYVAVVFEDTLSHATVLH